MKDSILQVVNLSKFDNKGNKILNNINFTINSGEIYGLVGIENSGKTTLTKVILGQENYTKGDVGLFGINDKRKYPFLLKYVGYSSEVSSLDKSLTVKEALELRMLLLEKFEPEYLDKIMDIVGLNFISDTLISKITIEEKSRLCLVLALVNNPQLVILDNILEDLDYNDCKSLKVLIKFLAEKLGLTILITSTSLNRLYGLATKYGIIDKGEIIKEVNTKDAVNSCTQYIKLSTTDLDKTIFVLVSELNVPFKSIKKAGNELHLYIRPKSPKAISDALEKNGINVTGIKHSGINLDEFLVKTISSNRK